MAKKSVTKKKSKLAKTDELAVLGIKLSKAKKEKVIRAVMASFKEGEKSFNQSKRKWGSDSNAWLHRSRPTLDALLTGLGISDLSEFRIDKTLDERRRTKLFTVLCDSVDEWVCRLFSGTSKRTVVKELDGLDMPYEEAAARIIVNLTLRRVNGGSLVVSSSELVAE